MPISRVHSQLGTRGKVQQLSSTATKSCQSGDVPIPRLYTHPRVDSDSDGGQSPSSLSPIRSDRNSDPGPSPTSGTDNEWVGSDDQSELGQEVELRHLIKESPMSPKLSPISDEYIEKAFGFSKSSTHLTRDWNPTPRSHDVR